MGLPGWGFRVARAPVGQGAERRREITGEKDRPEMLVEIANALPSMTPDLW